MFPTALNLDISEQTADFFKISAQALLLHLIIGFGLSFIPPAQLFRRAALLIISVSMAFDLQISKTNGRINGYAAGMLCFALWSNILRSANFLFLKGVQITPKINSSGEMDFYRPCCKTSSNLSRLFSATTLPLSARSIGTRWAAKRLPPFSAQNPTLIPSRRAFLFKTALTFVLAYAVIDFPNLFPPLDPEEAFSAAKEAIFTRVLDVTAEEFISRSIMVFIHWLMLGCYITMTYSALAIIFVGLGMPAQAWPPAFGSFRECYTIRQFWGVCWHQMLRNYLEPLSDFLSTTVLRIRKGTWLNRYARLGFSFWISGVIHVAIDMCHGVHPKESGAVRFFLMHAGGIIVEDAVQGFYHFCGGGSDRWTRSMGFLWTGLFFVWTTPSWVWGPNRVLFTRGTKTLPFSFVKYFVGKSQ